MLPYALPIIIALAGYFVFAAAVGAMYPPSEEQKPRFYGWLYRFLQRLAANADKLVEARFPALAPAIEGTSITRESAVILTSSSATK